MTTNLVHLLGDCLIAAGLAVAALSWRHYRRPPAEPQPEPDPYSEPGSLFQPHTPDRTRR